MNVAVIGLGSMGKRRIRLIKQYDENIKIIGIDLNAQRCKDAEKEYSIETCSSVGEARVFYSVEAVFISTSPLSHSKIIRECLSLGLHVFTELNLISDGYAENMALANEKGCVLFLSSTFLYRDEVGYIKNAVDNSGEKLSYNYHIGQYLPDWHPWESYKNFFISDKRTNGCREIFAIELPWLTEVFGSIKSVSVIKSRMTKLDIDYPDNYMVLLEHENGHSGVLCVDVVSRKAVRNFELYGENLYISWNGSPTGLSSYDTKAKCDINIDLYDKIDKLSGYSSNIIENAYFNEVKCFFGTVSGTDSPRYTFAKDEMVLGIIDKLEGDGN